MYGVKVSPRLNVRYGDMPTGPDLRFDWAKWKQLPTRSKLYALKLFDTMKVTARAKCTFRSRLRAMCSSSFSSASSSFAFRTLSRPSLLDHLAEVTEAFASIDADNSGTLDKAEIAAVVGILGDDRATSAQVRTRTAPRRRETRLEGPLRSNRNDSSERCTDAKVGQNLLAVNVDSHMSQEVHSCRRTAQAGGGLGLRGNGQKSRWPHHAGRVHQVTLGQSSESNRSAHGKQVSTSQKALYFFQKLNRL